MTQKSLHWDGASLGDADTLTVNAADGIGWRLGNTDYESPFVDLALRMILNGTGNRGVLKGWANELACAGVATPVTVATGGAVVYGMPYENTAVVNVVVPTPTNDTRYDYIVLRRDWTAQTIRITRIVGVEGGGIPALTQSPAPSGTGVYDVPLATLAIDIAGAITVTDAREWCTFSTVPIDDGLATANFTNESADWAARATRTKRAFWGGGDWQPASAGSDLFSYTTTSWLTLITGSTWGSAAATEEGWRAAGLPDYGWTGTFKLPADYAGGTVTAYVWWMDDCGAALTYYWYTAWQGYGAAGAVTRSGARTSTYINATYATGEVYRAAAQPIIGMTTADLIHYACQFYNTAGTEAILFLGLELEYTGYL